MNVFSKLLLGAAVLWVTAGTAQAQFGGIGASIARRYVGPQVRFASPAAYSALLAANRSIPPQVKNQWGNGGRYRGTPWNAELNYIRSMPPEVRNSIDRQERQQFQRGGYVNAPQVIYVPVPVPLASMPTGARHNATSVVPPPPVPGYIPNTGAAVIPAPPPPEELPDIVRQY